MRVVKLDEIRVAGALGTDTSAYGTVFRRLPDASRHQIMDIALGLMITMPAGVRLELATDASEVELDVLLTGVVLNDQPKTPTTFDLVVEGLVVASTEAMPGNWIRVDTFTEAIEIETGEASTVRLDALAPADGPRAIEIWLPHNCVVELAGVRVTAGASVAAAEVRRPRWIHHGSSISHCMEVRQPTETWPAIVARLAAVDLMNLAFAGQCMLDQTVARTIRDEPADFISIKAGINIVNGDTMRERTFGPALHGFIDTIRDGHPTTPLVVATPIFCPSVEDHPGPTALGRDGRTHAPGRPAELARGALSLVRIRQLVGEVVSTRQAAGDDQLFLLDGLELFGPEDAGDLPDDLHPNAAGYRRIADRFHALAFGDGGAFS